MSKIKEVFEIRLHGRAGQGAKTAAQLIAEAGLDSGKNVQAFPEYGPERMGAPMNAYVRISDKAITTYQPVLSPDVVLVIDPYFIDQFPVADGLDEKEGVLIVNTHRTVDEVRKATKFKGKIFAVDATKIAIETIKADKPNTPMIGTLVKATNIIKLDAVNEKIKHIFLKKLGEEKTNANIKAVKRGHDEAKEG